MDRDLWPSSLGNRISTGVVVLMVGALGLGTVFVVLAVAGAGSDVSGNRDDLQGITVASEEDDDDDGGTGGAGDDDARGEGTATGGSRQLRGCEVRRAMELPRQLRGPPCR